MKFTFIYFVVYIYKLSFQDLEPIYLYQNFFYLRMGAPGILRESTLKRTYSVFKVQNKMPICYTGLTNYKEECNFIHLINTGFVET